jgi:hypothetical protein
MLTGVSEPAVDHILSWSCVALGPADGNPHAGRSSRVGAGICHQPQPSHIPECTGCPR